MKRGEGEEKGGRRKNVGEGEKTKQKERKEKKTWSRTREQENKEILRRGLFLRAKPFSILKINTRAKSDAQCRLAVL